MHASIAGRAGAVALLGIACLVITDGVVRGGAPAVLDLPGGGVLPGDLGATSAAGPEGLAAIPWRSEVFAAPLEFRLDEIVGVRLLETDTASPAAAFRFQLRGGDLLDGELVGIDAEHVRLTPRGSDRVVRVRRDRVEAVMRVGSRVAGTYVGPGGLAGWAHAPKNVWRSEAGRITAAQPGTASIDVAAPVRAVYDMVVSWRHPPDLRIACNAAAKEEDDGFWVELLRLVDGSSEAAIVRRSRQTAALEPLAIGDGSASSLRLVVFVDQAKGRLAAFSVVGGIVGPVSSVTLPQATEPTGRFRLTLGSGDVCLESLRVGPWTADEPVLTERDTASVVAKDGRRIDAAITAFDDTTRTVLLGEGADAERVSLDDIEEIALPRRSVDEADDGVDASVRLVLASGGTIAGRLAAIDAEHVHLTVAGIDDPLVLPRRDVAAITSLVTRVEPRELPGRIGTLIAGDARLRGCLADGRHDWSTALAFLPQGAVGSSPLGAGASATAVVEYVVRAERSASGPGEVEVGGIGGMVNVDATGFFVVTMLSEEGAAARDGRLQPGDRLLAIQPRPDRGFVMTQGHDITTVMNLLRGRVGSPVVLRVASPEGASRDIDLRRGAIYMAGRDVLDQALSTHERLAVATPVIADGEEFVSVAIMRSGDVVPCQVKAIDPNVITMRTPVSGAAVVKVPERFLQAIELDPSVPSRGIERPRFERLLVLPRMQRAEPPTQMIRLTDGDYLRGRLVALDGEWLTIDVRGEMKKLPRSQVARVIWLHPDPAVAAGDSERDEAEDQDAAPAGLVVQGVADGRRITLVAEGLGDGGVIGTSPALGPGRIDLGVIDRLLIGGAIEAEAGDLPYRQWKLRPAPEPRALRDASSGR